MHFFSESTTDGIVERTFSLDDVPGILWSPASAVEPSSLVLMGHPGGMHKRMPAFVSRATHLVSSLGFHVAAIDAPGHGDRPRSDADTAWVEKIGVARRAGQPLGPIVSEFNDDLGNRAVPEWQAVLDAVLALPEVGDGAVGYSGMTLATEIGARLVAADDRIGAAVLGCGFAFEPLLEVMRHITVPVQYLLSWDDPEIDRESGLALWDAIGSEEKSLHINPGSHRRVPAYETTDSEAFFARHLTR